MVRAGFVLALLFSVSVAAQRAAPQADPAVLQRHAKEGERALAEKRYADAEKAFEALRELSPETAEVHAQLGVIYFQQGKFSEAVPSLQKALKLKPGLPNAGTLLAMSLSELGRYEEALPALEKGFRAASDPALKRLAGLHLERAYTGLKRDADAVDVALQLTKLYPKDAEILYQTGRLFANYAYLTTMRLAEVAPDSVWMHQAAGEANESQGLYDAAAREYEEVLRRDPRRPGMHFRLGRALLSRSRAPGAEGDAASVRAAALAEFQQELAIDPSNANAAYEAGEINRQAGRLPEARTFFETAINHYPEFEEALVGLGRVLIALGSPDAAVAPLTKATAVDPENAVAFYQLSLAHRALGNTAAQEKALAEFERLRQAKARSQEPIARPPAAVTQQELDQKPPQW